MVEIAIFIFLDRRMQYAQPAIVMTPMVANTGLRIGIAMFIGIDTKFPHNFFFLYLFRHHSKAHLESYCSEYSDAKNRSFPSLFGLFLRVSTILRLRLPERSNTQIY